MPIVLPGQVWEDNDWRSKGRLLLVVSVEPSALAGGHADQRVLVEVVRSRERATGLEDSRARGRRRRIKRSRFKPTSTGYRLTDLTAEDVS